MAEVTDSPLMSLQVLNCSARGPPTTQQQQQHENTHSGKHTIHSGVMSHSLPAEITVNVQLIQV